MKALGNLTVLCLVLFCMIIFAANGASAVEQKAKKFYSIKFGYYGEGTMTVKSDDNEAEFDTESGIAFGIAIDVPTDGWLMPGFAFDINEIKFPGDNTMAYNFVGTLKGDFRTSGRSVAIRPGIGAGAALVPEVGYVDNSIHFTFRATNEIIYFFEQGAGILAEIGLIWDLYGNAGEHTVHGGPFFFIRGGFGF